MVWSSLNKRNVPTQCILSGRPMLEFPEQCRATTDSILTHQPTMYDAWRLYILKIYIQNIEEMCKHSTKKERNHVANQSTSMTFILVMEHMVGSFDNGSHKYLGKLNRKLQGTRNQNMHIPKPLLVKSFKWKAPVQLALFLNSSYS